jgi:hypothetical protein
MLEAHDYSWLETMAHSPFLTVMCAGAALWTIMVVLVITGRMRF